MYLFKFMKDKNKAADWQWKDHIVFKSNFPNATNSIRNKIFSLNSQSQGILPFLISICFRSTHLRLHVCIDRGVEYYSSSLQSTA